MTNRVYVPPTDDQLAGGAMNQQEIRGAVARGWCSPENAHKEMDSVLALAIADEIEKLVTGSISAGIEHAWGLIANAWGGDWGKAGDDWKTSAIRWRDEFFHPYLIAAYPNGRAAQEAALGDTTAGGAE